MEPVLTGCACPVSFWSTSMNGFLQCGQLVLFGFWIVCLAACDTHPQASRVEPSVQQVYSEPSPVPVEKKAPSTPPPPAERNKSRLKWISFYESSNHDLEKKLIGRKDASGIRTIQKQIDENNARIAKLRAEMGE